MVKKYKKKSRSQQQLDAIMTASSLYVYKYRSLTDQINSCSARFKILNVVFAIKTVWTVYIG